MVKHTANKAGKQLARSGAIVITWLITLATVTQVSTNRQAKAIGVGTEVQNLGNYKKDIFD